MGTPFPKRWLVQMVHRLGLQTLLEVEKLVALELHDVQKEQEQAIPALVPEKHGLLVLQLAQTDILVKLLHKPALAMPLPI